MLLKLLDSLQSELQRAKAVLEELAMRWSSILVSRRDEVSMARQVLPHTRTMFNLRFNEGQPVGRPKQAT